MTKKGSFFDRFFDFVAKRNINKLSLIDMLDYFLQGDADKENFSFKNRTEASVLSIVREWHEEVNRVKKLHVTGKEVYPFLGIYPWSYMVNGIEYTCSQIMNYKDLCMEGRAMRHCVAAYHTMCLSGRCSIFSLKEDGKSFVTLEVRDKRIVQARMYANGSLTPFAMKVVKKFADVHRFSLSK